MKSSRIEDKVIENRETKRRNQCVELAVRRQVRTSFRPFLILFCLYPVFLIMNHFPILEEARTKLSVLIICKKPVYVKVNKKKTIGKFRNSCNPNAFTIFVSISSLKMSFGPVLKTKHFNPRSSDPKTEGFGILKVSV